MCDLLAKLHNRKIQSILSRRIKISYICNQPIFWLVQVPNLWNRFRICVEQKSISMKKLSSCSIFGVEVGLHKK